MKDVNDRDLPDWAVAQLREALKPRKPAKVRKRGLITIIPNDVDPEVWAARQGLV